MVTPTSSLRIASFWIRRKLVRTWNRLRGRTPDGYLFPSTYDGIVETENGTIIGYFNATPGSVERLRKAAAKAGLDIEIAEGPADPSAVKPPQPVKEDR